MQFGRTISMSVRAVIYVLVFILVSPRFTATPQSQQSRCPAGYVLVPALSGYTAFDFCVAKYEMKDDGGVARSQPAGPPWVNISRDDAMDKCQALGPGYDLISVDQWQSVARSIADTAVNWSSGMAYVGELNTGNSDGSPGHAIAADIDDNNACAGTGETCSATVWNSQRRTHTLSNGSVVWDLAGNVWDLVRDTNVASQGPGGFIATFNTGDARQVRFGHDQFCPAAAAPHCGFGWGYMDNAAGSIRRGGDSDSVNGNVYGAGVFSTNLNFPVTYPQGIMGFRCSFQP
jgi:formylglycine-generating enzyme required for sulfatase activity